MQRAALVRIILLSLVILFYSSCEETVEGCLDLLAENYDFTAVDACQDCCTYPSLSMSLSLMNDTLSFDIGDTLTMNQADSIVIDRFLLLFSEFRLTGLSSEYKVIDSVELRDSFIRDDFAFFDDEGTSVIGDTRFADFLEEFHITLGFSDLFSNLSNEFDNLDQDSRLDEALDSLFIGGDKYSMAAFTFKYTSWDSLHSYQLPNTGETLMFNIGKEVSAGRDWRLEASIDLQQLFHAIEPELSDESIKEMLANNLSRSINIK